MHARGNAKHYQAAHAHSDYCRFRVLNRYEQGALRTSRKAQKLGTEGYQRYQTKMDNSQQSIAHQIPTDTNTTTTIKNWVAWHCIEGDDENKLLLQMVNVLFCAPNKSAPNKSFTEITQAMRLHVCDQTLCIDACIALASLISNHRIPHLKYLSLCNTGIGVHGMRTLAQSLSKGAQVSLQVLNLRANNIGDAGAKFLGKALESFDVIPCLQKIDLAQNRISCTGLIALASGLRTRPLNIIDLGNNSIGEDGVDALVAPGSALCYLEGLILWSNRVTDTGCFFLVQAVTDNILPSIKYIELYRNPLSNESSYKVVLAIVALHARLTC